MGFSVELRQTSKEVVNFMRENVGTFSCAGNPSNIRTCTRPLKLDLARKILPSEAVALCCRDCPTYAIASYLLMLRKRDEMLRQIEKLEPLSH